MEPLEVIKNQNFSCERFMLIVLFSDLLLFLNILLLNGLLVLLTVFHVNVMQVLTFYFCGRYRLYAKRTSNE